MTSTKRSNPALWKISIAARTTAASQIKIIVDNYAKLSRKDAVSYPPLVAVRLQQKIQDVTLSLYIRNRSVAGFSSFIADYLATDRDRSKFTYRVVDVCLFIATKDSLRFSHRVGL